MQKQNIHYKKTIPALLATLILACLGLGARNTSRRPSFHRRHVERPLREYHRRSGGLHF